ncbi:KTSC domain-containing protein [Pseudobacter ginsenosidimutans]|uniref:KTSC domain-containing protein n=1 Tax=Pseudobacter ginsenosidimutans TaxID=661488 RepID=A0A4Q7N1Q8_9BACT|nr:KTSC domain-containing protein [Pseudobacter ginsenosidimutans]RZS74559.1 KTSC domain-containing protein [Pseudobacter ginsenosidimutans]
MPSTVIASFSYDETAQTLLIQFVSGSRYLYYRVPKQVVEEFKRYREKGVFYNLHVNGKFSFSKIQ